MKKFILFLFLAVASMISIDAVAQGSTPRNPGPGNKCGYSKIIPNSPNPIRIVCQNAIAPGCNGYCATHCVRNLVDEAPKTICNYVKIIPNQPNPIRVSCSEEAVAGCNGYCQAHCSVATERRPSGKKD